MELLTASISARPGLGQSWDMSDRCSLVTITAEGSPRFVTVDMISVEVFDVRTSNGFWGLEWATQDTVEEQAQAFDDLVDDLVKFLDGRYRIRAHRRLLGGIRLSLEFLGGPSDVDLVLDRKGPRSVRGHAGRRSSAG